MPARNSRKIYDVDSYYHVYNRGVNKRSIFKSEDDYVYFLGLLKRYLDPGSESKDKDRFGRIYPSYADEIKLRAFCLMPNHFHLLLFQYQADSLKKFMNSLSIAYTMYFNKKYKRVGPLFQDRYKASIIQSQSYLEHISRYIHLNPDEYLTWKFSSLQYYRGEANVGWVDQQPILDIFGGSSYLEFLADYEGHREMLKEIKHTLADK